MTKIIFGINVPYQSQEIDWEATDAQRKEVGYFTTLEFIRKPCIRIHKQMSFELCDVCGNQIVGGRAKRKITTCCPEHNKKKWDTTNGIVLERERNLCGARPTIFWNQMRRECFERDDYKCQGENCGIDIREYNPSKPPHAHHIVRVVDGGSNKLENLKTLCYHCHKIAHSRTMNIRRKHKPLVVD